jgi:hypothetical protein
MRNHRLTLAALMSLVCLLSLISFLPVQGNDSLMRLLLTATPSPSPTVLVTAAPTVVAPFNDTDTVYTLLEPQGGSLVHDIDDTLVSVYEVPLAVADFALSARFFNPYSTTTGTWDYGFFFRDSANQQFRIAVTSSGTWSFLYRVADETVTSIGGELDNLDTSTGGSNVLRLVVSGEKALFAVNDVEVGVVDVSLNMALGSISLATGLFTGNEQDDAVTRYEDFTIWTIGLVPTFTPTAAAQTGLEAEVGEQRGELEDGGGQVWEYEGEEGEVLTIQVIADQPYADGSGEVNSNGLDTYLLVRAPDGTILAEADDVELGVITNTLVEDLELPEDGVYELEVRSWENTSGGEYTLIIESDGPAADDDDPSDNNTPRPPGG